MRGASTTIGRRIPSSDSFFTSSCNHSSSLLPYSTSSGRGRGSGPASGLPTFDFPNNSAPGKVDQNGSVTSQPPQLHQPGAGHGRAKPLNADSVTPAFSSFLSSIKSTRPGAGRGNGSIPFSTPPKIAPPPSNTEIDSQKDNPNQQLHDDLSPMSAAGRGKPLKPVPAVPKVTEKNRHIHVREGQSPKPTVRRNEFPKSEAASSSKDNAPKPGKSKWKREINKERDRRPMGDRETVTRKEEEKKIDSAMEAASKAQVEKLAKLVGDDTVRDLEQIFVDILYKNASAPVEEEIDRMHTDCAIEFEPEYLMGQFNQNPDIDEKPPMSLETFIDKIKPFMIEFMQIQSHEEWEGAVRDLHKNIPLMKEIVDYYSGPDRITAKTQEEKLIKLAEGVPSNTPIAMKDFVDRAVISLQGNPGWKFDKKCHFMNKLVGEVQKYKSHRI